MGTIQSSGEEQKRAVMKKVCRHKIKGLSMRCSKCGKRVPFKRFVLDTLPIWLGIFAAIAAMGVVTYYLANSQGALGASGSLAGGKK